MIAAAGIAVERHRRVVRARHALSRPDPHASRCRCRSRRRHAASRPTIRAGVRDGLSRRRSAGCFPGLPMRIVSLRVAAIGRRPPFDFSAFGAGAAASLEKARLGARQRLVRRRLARHRDLVAARSAGRRDDRGAGDPGAARRHHRDRAGAGGARRRARQSHSWSARDEIPTTSALMLGDLQNDFLHPRRRLRPRRAGRSGDRGAAGKARAAGGGRARAAAC